MTKLKAWLATARFANLPTIWSHCFVVVVFYALYLVGSDWQLAKSISPTNPNPEDWIKQFNQGALGSIKYIILTTMIAGSSLYLGGCILGDYFDRYFDLKFRPERPIPQKIILPENALIVALFFLFFGFCVFLLGVQWTQHFQQFTPHRLHDHFTIFTTSPDLLGKISYALQSITLITTVILVTCIISYARFHKKIPQLGLILMAGCRFSLIICAWKYVDPSFFRQNPEIAFAFPKEILGYATASAIYTMGIVFVARTESTPARFNRQKALMLFMFVLPLLSIGFTSEFSSRFAVAGLIFFLWAGVAYLALRKNDKGTFVSRALAGFCLLDCIAIAAFTSQFADVPDIVPVLKLFTSLFPIFICFGFFCLSLLLQKFTPAT